jgi:hypothetical protein
MANFMVGVDYVEDLLSEVDLQTEENKKLVEELLGKKERVSAVPDPDISELEEAPAVGGALVRKLCSGGPLDVVLHRVGFGDASPWWLDDRATGEARGLPKLEPGNVWATGNAGAGDDQRGYAAQYNEESKVTSNWIWLDEFLRLRLHRSSNPPDWEDVLDEAERGLLILDPSTSGTAWRSEQRRAKTARGLTHTLMQQYAHGCVTSFPGGPLHVALDGVQCKTSGELNQYFVSTPARPGEGVQETSAWLPIQVALGISMFY